MLANKWRRSNGARLFPQMSRLPLPPRRLILKVLGERLRRLRLDRQLSQTRLAQLSGLHYQFFGRIELGHAEPAAITLLHLAHALDVPIAELFGEALLGTSNSAASTMAPKSIAPARAAVDDALRTDDRESQPQRTRAPRSRPRRRVRRACHVTGIADALPIPVVQHTATRRAARNAFRIYASGRHPSTGSCRRS